MAKIKLSLRHLLIIALLFTLSVAVYAFLRVNQNYNPELDDDYSNIADFSNYKKWGIYNVHDPSCIKWGDNYYVYSTDAIWIPPHRENQTKPVNFGNIQVRRSSDLVHWEFVGWVFDSIPAEAKHWVVESSGGKIPNGIWAPYAMVYNGEIRLYYSVSIFGANTSYIGMARSKTPLGPWTHVGCVVKTSVNDAMNAIDPTVVIDSKNGRQWMIYGSFFGGIYGVELDPQTGLTKNANDKGHLIARRANGNVKVIEAPEVIYNPQFKKYYLFVSYDALFTHYNVRVGRSDNPSGPYYDMFGNNLADTTNNYPVLTYAYRFQHHPGWAGVGHCAILRNDNKFFMLHQGRLAPDNQQMILHVRQIFWTSDGWPVVSPERFANIPQSKIKEKNLIGTWEIITLNELDNNVKLWQGQIPWGGWKYDTTAFNNFQYLSIQNDFTINGGGFNKWAFKNNHLILINSADSVELNLANEWDWERKKPTIVFSGINKQGLSIWGKKISN